MISFMNKEILAKDWKGWHTHEESSEYAFGKKLFPYTSSDT